ncbi:MASE1 domain-containing protein [Streptomyces sp. NPDC094472]|uniref:MASE1 domain-containing protein n=1 Tax=Streptomyces sp. NPDC094472 TaxID=3155080 RepID=UPI003322873F
MAAVARDTGIRRKNGFRRHGATALRLVAVAALYYAAAWIGLLQELVRDQVTPLWPPTGIALACLLTLGPMAWPGIALGAVAVNAPIGPSPLAVLAIVVGNTLAPICSYLLLRRVGFRPALDRLRDALVLVFLGALAGMLISATVGTAALIVSGALTAGDFWTAWSVWWTGDAMGVLVITPLLLVLHRLLHRARLPRGVSPYRLLHRARLPRGVSPYRLLEAAALLLGTAAVTLVATRTEVSLLFLVFPFLIWAALRFQLAGAAPCSLIVSVLAIAATAEGTGPFSHHSLPARMVILQAFNGSTALTALLLSAIIAERNATRRQIEHVCAQLAEAVFRLAPDEPRPPEGDRKSTDRR